MHYIATYLPESEITIFDSFSIFNASIVTHAVTIINKTTIINSISKLAVWQVPPIWEKIKYGAFDVSTLPITNPLDLTNNFMVPYKNIWDALYLNDFIDASSVERDRILSILFALEQKFPFNRLTYSSVWDIYSKMEGRGIVMYTGDETFM